MATKIKRRYCLYKYDSAVIDGLRVNPYLILRVDGHYRGESSMKLLAPLAEGSLAEMKALRVLLEGEI